MLKYLRLNIMICVLFTAHDVFCQSISASFGPVFTKTNAVVAIVNGKEGFSNTAYMFSFSYEHFFKEKPYSIIASYAKYDGCTFILFEKGGFIPPDGVPVDATGFCAGVDINRFDLGVTYNIIKNNKKFYLKPFLTTGIQISTKTGWEIYSDLVKINGPNYFELEPISADPRNTTQIVPSLGFRTGFVFWKRLDIGLSFQGVYAYNPYQKMYLKYQYKGVVQPTAEYESTGTGLFVTFGVGYRFINLIK